jgi:hypothetical protein
MTWGDETKNPAPDWTMSAALTNVVREGEQLPEVTNLKDAVLAWSKLDANLRKLAVLTVDRAILVDGVQSDRFEGEGVAALMERMKS